MCLLDVFVGFVLGAISAGAILLFIDHIEYTKELRKKMEAIKGEN